MFYDRLETMCKTRNIKITPFVVELGLSKGNIGKWRSGVVPNGEVLTKIADALDCSVDYLLGRTDTPLTENEQLLLDIIRELDDDKKQLLFETAKAMANKN